MQLALHGEVVDRIVVPHQGLPSDGRRKRRDVGCRDRSRADLGTRVEDVDRLGQPLAQSQKVVAERGRAVVVRRTDAEPGAWIEPVQPGLCPNGEIDVRFSVAAIALGVVRILELGGDVVEEQAEVTHPAFIQREELRREQRKVRGRGIGDRHAGRDRVGERHARFLGQVHTMCKLTQCAIGVRMPPAGAVAPIVLRPVQVVVETVPADEPDQVVALRRRVEDAVETLHDATDGERRVCHAADRVKSQSASAAWPALSR